MTPSFLARILGAAVATAIPAFANITLECDFTSAADQGQPMHYHWGISNRISPMRGMNQPVGEEPLINIVRPLGGKSKNGQMLIDEDTYRWDGRKYIYDWAPLKQQIKTVQRSAKVYQLMIDNPPWAFQRGIDLKGEPAIETYGNAWPPNDPEAWATYIQELLKELVRTYGKETVEQWRYCIGREIGTKGHWRGTMLEFFEHYRITEQAIHAIVPKAKVGTHYLWASSKHSFGPDFVRWCHQHKVRYDFIGVSYYPFYHRKERVDMQHVYEVDFSPIKDIPEWNPSATLEIHEFALITSMSKKGNSFENAPDDHQESFTVMLAKMMYEHDMVDIFRWGSGKGKIAEQTFLGMQGNRYFRNSKKGEPATDGNMVDAVFAHDEQNHQYNMMVASYNADPQHRKAERVEIKTRLPLPPGSTVTMRNAIYENERLEWSDWKTVKTTARAGSVASSLEFDIELAPFSFQKVEINYANSAPTAPLKTSYVLTDQKTGIKAEVILIDVKNGVLFCNKDGRRLEIPISSLNDEDVAFLRKWMETR